MKLQQFSQPLPSNAVTLDTTSKQFKSVNLFLSRLCSFKAIKENVGEGEGKLEDTRLVPLPDIEFNDQGKLSELTELEFRKLQDDCLDILSNCRSIEVFVALALSQGLLRGVTGLFEVGADLSEAIEVCWDEFYPPLRADRKEAPGIERLKAFKLLARKKLKTTFLNRMPIAVLPDGRFLSMEALKIANGDHNYFVTNQLRRVNKASSTAIFSENESNRYTKEYVNEFINSAGKELIKEWLQATGGAIAIFGSNGTIDDRFVRLCNESSKQLGGTGMKTSPLLFRELDQYLCEVESILKEWLSSVEVQVNSVPSIGEGTAGAVENTTASIASASKPNLAVMVASSNTIVQLEYEAEVLIDSSLSYLLSNERSNPAIIFIFYARQLIGLSFVEILNFFTNKNANETSVMAAASELSGGFGKLLLEKIQLGEMDAKLEEYQVTICQKYVNGSKAISQRSRFDSSPVNESSSDQDQSHDRVDSDVRPLIKVMATRGEAMSGVKAAADYFRLNEPASPVSDLLSRAVSVAGTDFMGALENLTGQNSQSPVEGSSD